MAGHRLDVVRRSRLARTALAVLLLAGVLTAGLVLALWEEPPPAGQSVDEKIAVLRTERAALEARADAAARIELLPAFRTASLLLDALVVRSQGDGNHDFDLLPANRRNAFGEVDALNAALKEAIDRQSEGARQAALAAAQQAAATLDRLPIDRLPVVLAYSPRFVPPRRANGELTLAPAKPGAPQDEALKLEMQTAPATAPRVPAAPAVARYAPGFATAPEQDPPLQIEILGTRLGLAGDMAPVLTIGSWRGQATVLPERLQFVVPRSAFITDARRTSLAAGTLSLRRGPHSITFQLLFTVLPDRPGSFAFDQKVRTTTLEYNTLVSPEILARGAAGETRTVRRCFDPPSGWRFDKEQLRIVIVDRLGWQEDDVSDATLNDGTVEFVTPPRPEQVCLAVTARPVMNTARAATIGRFEATLVRDAPSAATVKSGVRALDWREPVRVPIEPNMIEWKLYLRLFDDIDREFGGVRDGDLPATATPFLRISRENGGKVLVLEADPTAEP